MTRVAHVASLEETLSAFVAPFHERALDDGYEFVYVATPAPKARAMGRPVHPVALPRGRKAMAAWLKSRQFSRQLNSLQADLIHVHTPATAVALYPALSALDSTRLYTARGGFDEGVSRWQQLVWSRMDPALWRKWHAVTVLNHRQLERLVARTDHPTATLIDAGGLPQPRMHPLSLHEQDGPPVLLWVGRLDRDKRPGDFLALLDALVQAGVAVKGRVVGDVLPGDRPPPRILGELRRNPHVDWTGWVDRGELDAHYASAALAVGTSAREGFGRGPLEAAVHGTPTIAYSTNGTLQSVTEVGGQLVDTGDLAALVRAVVGWSRFSRQRQIAWRRAVHARAAGLAARDIWLQWKSVYDALT